MVAGGVGFILVFTIAVLTFKYRRTKVASYAPFFSRFKADSLTWFTFFGYYRKWRNLTIEEVEEFLRGDPTAAALAPDGLDRALKLPYTHVFSPEDIFMGIQDNF